MDNVETCRQAIQTGLEEGDLDLPALPSIAGEILSIISDENAQMDDLAEVIYKDQILAGHILKAANTASGGSNTRVDTLSEAIARLGMRMLGDIAIAITLQSDVYKIPKFAEFTKNAMEHALASGLYAREIARILKRTSESLFLCGLLHTIGEPAVLRLIIKIMDEQEIDLSTPEIKELVEEFKIQVGRNVSAKWKMPQIVQICTGYYRTPEIAPAHQEECYIIHLAGQFARFVVNPEQKKKSDLEIDPAMEKLKVDEDQFLTLLEKAEGVSEMISALRMPSASA